MVLSPPKVLACMFMTIRKVTIMVYVTSYVCTSYGVIFQFAICPHADTNSVWTLIKEHALQGMELFIPKVQL